MTVEHPDSPDAGHVLFRIKGTIITFLLGGYAVMFAGVILVAALLAVIVAVKCLPDKTSSDYDHEEYLRDRLDDPWQDDHHGQTPN